MAMARVGISGWRYPPWRKDFYPKGLPQRSELSYAAQRLTSIEINGSFYSLQLPSSYYRWRHETPDDFVFSVKGSRFITHMTRLRRAETTLPNYFASGLLALGGKLGPILWQLPPTMAFDAELITTFLDQLPRSTGEAAYLARRHGERQAGRSWTGTLVDGELRHAVEVRHDSFARPEAVDLLRSRSVALVVADTAGKWPQLFDVTADFVYVRLHGADELYTSGYDEPALQLWAERIRGWTARGLDVFCYFDNDVKVRAPYDAMSLIRLLAPGASVLAGSGCEDARE
ncbi:MAG: hypothetical protein JWN95_1639 [Frankiales bacterium]|nr:hypothetical protein [Frankiales bacterium]